MEECINTKLEKGYKFLLPQKSPQETKELLPVPSILGKRSNPNDQAIIMQAGEISKKIHPSSTSSVLNPQLQLKQKANQHPKQNSYIVIDDEDEEIVDGNSLFIGLKKTKQGYKKRTEDSGRR